MTRDEQWLLEEKYGGDANAPGFTEDKHRLALGEPAAYVIGWQPFLGLKIYLDSKPLLRQGFAGRALIPSPETEWWTERLLTHVGTYHVPTLKFLDLCAGSGAIGCAALAKLPNAHVYFGEVDPAHEATILKNICENNLDKTRTDIRIGDLFEPFNEMQFNIIAVNPPYVPTSRVLPSSVADYEPMLALLAGEDGLDIIRRIAVELPKHLTKEGVAWIECDRGHAETARMLFTAQGFHAEIRTDQYGKPRFIVVSFPHA